MSAIIGSRLDVSAALAMAAGVSGRLWEIGDIVKLVEDAEATPGKCEPYTKRREA